MLIFERAAYTDFESALNVEDLSDTAIYVALDVSGSMGYLASNGQTRLTNAKTAINGVLAAMRDAGIAGQDMTLVAWSATVISAITRREMVAADYAALITWVNGQSEVLGTDFGVGVSEAPAFFEGSGDKERMLLFITDGGTEQVQGVETAVATLAGISDLSVYAFNIELDGTVYTSQLDNTPSDGVPVISGGDPAALEAALIRVFYSSTPVVVPAATLSVSRSYAPGYPQQTMPADGTTHAMLGEASLRARADLDGKRAWNVLIRDLTLSDWTAFQDFYYTTTRRGLRRMTWITRPSLASAVVRFSPTEPVTWTPVENTQGKFNLQFTIVEA